jgi:hypothetical protein
MLERALADVPNGWQYTEQCIKRALLEFIQKCSTQPKRKAWSDFAKENLDEVVRRKRFAYRTYLKSRTAQAEAAYREARREVRKLTRKTKDDYELTYVQDIEFCGKAGDSGSEWRLLKEFSKFLLHSEMPIYQRRSNDAVMTERLADHYKVLFNKTSVQEDMWLGSIPEGIFQGNELQHVKSTPPELGEVVSAIKQIKLGKAPGLNGLRPELFKTTSDTIAKRLCQDFAIIWSENPSETMPRAFIDANVVSLYKGKGSRSDPNMYRSIFLLDIAGKILARVLYVRIAVGLSRFWGSTQFGFRTGRSTSQAILLVRRLQYQAQIKRKSLCAMFVDLRKAFDSIPRKLLWTILTLLGVDPKLVEMLKCLHDTPVGTLVGSEVSFSMARGVRQGCVLGPILFNTVFAALLRISFPSNEHSNIGYYNDDTKESINLVHIEYADDLVFFAEHPSGLAEMLVKLDNTCRPYGIEIAPDKTKWMTLSEGCPNGNSTKAIQLNGQEIGQVTEFTYLGSIISHDGDISKEVATRLTKARSKLLSIRPLLKSSMTLSAKQRLLMACVVPVLVYGTETWTLRKQDCTRLSSVLNTGRRIILGSRSRQEHTIEELEQLVPLPSVASVIRTRQLRLLSKISACELLKHVMQGSFSSTKCGQPGKSTRDWLCQFHDDYSRDQTRAIIDGREIVEHIKKPATYTQPALVGKRALVIKCTRRNCHLKFAERKELLRHLRRDHKKLTTDIEQYPHRCTVSGCNKSYRTGGWLKAHLKKAHNICATDTMQTRSVSLKLKRIDGAKSDQSERTVPESVSVPWQERLVADCNTSGPPFRCGYLGCTKTLPTLKGIVNHASVVHRWSMITGQSVRGRRGKPGARRSGGNLTGLGNLESIPET